jgi:hypothetical protein
MTRENVDGKAFLLESYAPFAAPKAFVMMWHDQLTPSPLAMPCLLVLAPRLPQEGTTGTHPPAE